MLSGLSGDVTRPGNGVFSPWCPALPIFGEFDDAEEDVSAWWERRQAEAYIFGIHPMFAVMSPELDAEDMLETANVGTELDLEMEALDKAVDYLLK